MDERILTMAKTIKEQWPTLFDASSQHLAKHLHEAGYRLDPYPNGKSKDELIARIEAVEAERDKLAVALYGLGRGKYSTGELCFCEMRIGNPMVSVHSEQCELARKAVAETSSVKP